MTDTTSCPTFSTSPTSPSRGNRYLTYLAQRYLFGMPDVDAPVSTAGERAWFVVYTVLSLIYRIFIYAAIIQFIAGKFLTIGSAPRYVGRDKHGRHSPFQRRKVSVLVTPPRSPAAQGDRDQRGPRRRVCGLRVPRPPSHGHCGGRRALVPGRIFRQSEDGGVRRRAGRNAGGRVKRGDLLARCSDPLLPARIKVLESQLRELEVRYDMNERTDRVKALVTLEEIKQVRQQLDDARTRARELAIYSRADGTFYVPRAQDLPGRFLKRGDALGYVLNDHAVAARVVVYQSDVDLVRNRTYGVKIRMPERIATTLPSASSGRCRRRRTSLPGKALGQTGGGMVPIRPPGPEGSEGLSEGLPL